MTLDPFLQTKMAFIENFATQVREAYVNQDQILFSQLISIDVNNQNVLHLVQELVHVIFKNTKKIINARLI